MSRRRRGPIDREVVIFAAFILFTGFFIGFLLGRQSVSQKPAPEIITIEKHVPLPVPQVPKEQPEVIYPEVKPEAPKQERSVLSYINPFTKKKPKAPRIAIVIDDVGNGSKLEQLIWDLPERVTLAILPRLSHSQYFADEGRKRGFEIILHQPMEPLNSKEADDVGIIRANMKENEIRKILDENLRTTPGVIGANNHRGSKVTQDRRVMKVILEDLRSRGLFFLDSMTSANSIGWREADKIDLPHLKRDVFLDNELDPEYIRHQFEDLLAIAKKQGYAVGIGHYKTNTLTVLRHEIEQAREAGFQIVPLKDLL